MGNTPSISSHIQNKSEKIIKNIFSGLRLSQSYILFYGMCLSNIYNTYTVYSTLQSICPLYETTLHLNMWHIQLQDMIFSKMLLTLKSIYDYICPI